MISWLEILTLTLCGHLRFALHSLPISCPILPICCPYLTHILPYLAHILSYLARILPISCPYLALSYPYRAHILLVSCPILPISCHLLPLSCPILPISCPILPSLALILPYLAHILRIPRFLLHTSQQHYQVKSADDGGNICCFVSPSASGSNTPKNNDIQDRQCTHNLTLWHVRLMFIPPRLF